MLRAFERPRDHRQTPRGARALHANFDTSLSQKLCYSSLVNIGYGSAF